MLGEEAPERRLIERHRWIEHASSYTIRRRLQRSFLLRFWHFRSRRLGIAGDETQEIGSKLDQLTIAARRIQRRTLDREILIKRFLADSPEVIEAHSNYRLPYSGNKTYSQGSDCMNSGV
jgi:hypothetical protein